MVLGAGLIALHFPPNLRICPLGLIVTLHKIWMVWQRKTLWLIELLTKLWKKWSIVNTAPDHSEPEILKFSKSECMKIIFFSSNWSKQCEWMASMPQLYMVTICRLVIRCLGEVSVEQMFLRQIELHYFVQHFSWSKSSSICAKIYFLLQFTNTTKKLIPGQNSIKHFWII